MRGRSFSPEALASALMLAATIGDKAAAKKTGISVSVIRATRAAGTVSDQIGSVPRTLAERRLRVVEKGLERAERDFADPATPPEAVAKLLQVVGDLDLAARLTVERPREQSGQGPDVATTGRDMGRAPDGAHVHLDAQ